MKEKLDALPDGPSKNFLIEFLEYQVNNNSGERMEKRYKDEVMKLVEKHAPRFGAESS